MTQTRIEITDVLLMAYADGRASDHERTAVEAWLATNPERAAEVAEWQRQNDTLTALFPMVANEPVPARLSAHRIAREVAADRFGQFTRIAATIVLLVLGGAIGWGLRDAVTPVEAASDALIDSAVTAHVLYAGENRHAVEVAATDRDHLVNWLSNRVTRPIVPPDLSTEGFDFVGGRLLPTAAGAATGPAAQLMYENAANERVTIFITAALKDGDSAYQFESRAPLEAFYWANETITCTVVGELASADMEKLARKVYQQLTRRPDNGPSAYMR